MRKPKPTCSVVNCASVAHSKSGLCNMHLTELRRKGVVTERPSPGQQRPPRGGRKPEATEMANGQRFKEAAEGLPPELRPVLADLVLDYANAAQAVHRVPFVSQRVLAELVKGGWRRFASVDRAAGIERGPDGLPVRLRLS